jgi:uncharacterized membrane protein
MSRKGYYYARRTFMRTMSNYQKQKERNKRQYNANTNTKMSDGDFSILVAFFVILGIVGVLIHFIPVIGMVIALICFFTFNLAGWGIGLIAFLLAISGV